MQILTPPTLGSYEDQALIASPADPASGYLRRYSSLLSGRPFSYRTDSAGFDYVSQPALFESMNYFWTPTKSAAGLWTGTAGAGGGTYANHPPTSLGYLYTLQKRSAYSNVATTTNQVIGQNGSEALFFCGNTAFSGGFFYVCRFGLEAAWTAGDRLFVGLASNNSAIVSANPSASHNVAGFCVESTDSDITFLTANGSTFTKATFTGPTFAQYNGYAAYIYCLPNSSTIYYRLDNLNLQTTLVDTSTTATTPAINTMMYPLCTGSNGANTAAGAISLGVNRIYIETVI